MKNLSITKIIFYLLIVISIVVGLLLFLNTSSPVEELDMYVELTAMWSYVLLLIGAALAIIPSIIVLFKSKMKGQKALIVLGSFALIVFISYMLGDGSDYEYFELSNYTASLMVETTIYACYILGILAILTLGLSSVKKAFKA